MQDDSSWENITPNVYFLVAFHSDDLGSNIARSATAVKQIRFLVTYGCKSEIHNDHFQGILASEDNIFHFDISMHNAKAMQVGQSLYNALHDFLGFRQTETLFSVHAVDESASF